jgi:hypothetical protein
MFYDIQPRKKYSDFINEAESIKPYRSADGLRRYPLGKRAYSRRYWRFVDETTQKENPPIGIFYNDTLLLKYHSDDSVEFVSNYAYGQGDGGLVSSVLRGTVKSVSTLGGAVYYTERNRHNDMNLVMHPLFKGLRVNLSDGSAHESCKYEVHTYQVAPAKTKSFREPYSKMFSLATKLLKVMDKDQIYQEMMDYRSKYMPTTAGNNAWAAYWERDIEEIGQEFLQSQDAVGLVLHFGARYNYKDFSYWQKWSMHTYDRESPTLSEKKFPDTVKTRFLTELYKSLIAKGVDIHETYVTQAGQRLPTVKWGQRILVNGNEMARYS